MSGVPKSQRYDKKTRVESAFRIVERAVINGERCPLSDPHGPLGHNDMALLIQCGMVESFVSGRNFRQVKLLVGPYAGRSTAPHPQGCKPWRINGRKIDGTPSVYSAPEARARRIAAGMSK